MLCRMANGIKKAQIVFKFESTMGISVQLNLCRYNTSKSTIPFGLHWSKRCFKLVLSELWLPSRFSIFQFHQNDVKCINKSQNLEKKVLMLQIVGMGLRITYKWAVSSPPCMLNFPIWCKCPIALCMHFKCAICHVHMQGLIFGVHLDL